MKIRSSEFIKSAVLPSQYPTPPLPEIALSGRSNVGKSSLINKLLNRKKLVKTSQRPGKTRTLNYFLINENFYFVDVPGYGYAKVSKKEKEQWRKMLETYFTMNERLQAVVQLVDFRHPPTQDDVQMYAYLKYPELPTIVVGTKFDKVKKSHVQKNIKTVYETLQLQPEDEFVQFSAETAYGKDKLWAAIRKYI